MLIFAFWDKIYTVIRKLTCHLYRNLFIYPRNAL